MVRNSDGSEEPVRGIRSYLRVAGAGGTRPLRAVQPEREELSAARGFLVGRLQQPQDSRTQRVRDHDRSAGHGPGEFPDIESAVLVPGLFLAIYRGTHWQLRKCVFRRWRLGVSYVGSSQLHSTAEASPPSRGTY